MQARIDKANNPIQGLDSALVAAGLYAKHHINHNLRPAFNMIAEIVEQSKLDELVSYQNSSGQPIAQEFKAIVDSCNGTGTFAIEIMRINKRLKELESHLSTESGNGIPADDKPKVKSKKKGS